MFKKLIVLLLALVLVLGSLPCAVLAEGREADGLTLVFEDDLDGYGKDTAVNGTAIADFFRFEANAAGNGYIRVTEGAGGDPYLKSAVFTQVFNAVPIFGSYEFSLDIVEAQGEVSSGVFVRGLETPAGFYEGDGHPAASTSQSGLLIYPRPNKLGVNLKTYDPSWTEYSAYVQNHTVYFDLPKGTAYPYTLTVTDTAEEITILVNGTLICRVTVSDGGKSYEKHMSSEPCYASATLYDAAGKEKGSYTDTLLGSNGALFGWTTRATEMGVDNIRVSVGKVQQTVMAIEKLPATVGVSNLTKAKELTAAARALYDSLGSEQALIPSLDRLTSAEAAIKEIEATLNVEWPDPTYKDMETTPEDTAAGTLKYTLSEDGSTVTISYEVNGETLSYTVPNHENYLFGGYAATDDLGRSLYDSSAVGSYGAGKDRQIGLFYFLCQGEHGHPDKLVDLQKVLDQYGPESGATKNDELYPEGAGYWWGEPLYGYYYSNDAWVMRKHAELLTMAGVDFLYFDVTNAFTYTHNALTLMGILHDLNEQGFDAPQVVFYTASNSQTVIQKLYDEIYAKDLYPDTWYRIGGKPVIVGNSDFDADGFFTVKREQSPVKAPIDNGWPWIDFNWPQYVYRNRSGDGSAINVSVAQHSGTVVFSDSSLYGDVTNRGRSYSNPDGIIHRWGDRITPHYLTTLRTSYKAWQADQTLTLQGLNFQQQFDTAVASDATYILITGWNEWTVGNNAAAHNFAKPYYFTDCASMEFSRDAEMMRGGYFDGYFIQMVYNIQRLKGTAPIIVQDSRKPINVTGEFDQWQDVAVTYRDAQGDTDDRNALGGGKTTYTNTSGRNDIVAAKVTSDTGNLYFYIRAAHNISMFDTDSSWMQIYLNVDRETTGWYGYDFILNHKAKDAFTTTVARYSGTDGAYGFETVGEVSYRVKGNEMMIAVPLEMLEIEGYKEINAEFKIADSDTVYDEMEDFYCDGDVAPLGRMNYVYQNYIPGVSVITYPELETEPSQSEPTVTQPSAEDSDTPADSVTNEAERKGCRAAMPAGIAVMLLPAAAWMARKGKRAGRLRSGR